VSAAAQALERPAKRARRTSITHEHRYWHVALLVILLIVLVVSIFPYLYLLSTALRPRSEIFRFPPSWLPNTWAPQNFIDVWHVVALGKWILNSVFIAGTSTALTLVLAIPAGYALARLQFPGRRVFRQLLLVTQMFSPAILIIGLFRFMTTVRLTDTPLSLILTYSALSVAFSIWFLESYYRSVPEEIEEAAMVDGCSRVGALVRVILPSMAPALVATTVFAFIWAWNDFVIALTFIASPGNRTLPLGIYSFLGQYMIEWHFLMAAALIAVIPVVILFISIERWLVKGMTAGAVK
jgi:multiple sugar transport system permease protein